MHRQRRRAVITGIGPITAFGVGIDPLWDALADHRTAIAPIARFDASAFPCQFAAELPDDAFNIRSVVPKSHRKATKVMARDIELAVVAALAAVNDAALTTRGTDTDAPPTIDPDRFGCQIGAGLIAADVDELTAALHESRAQDGGVDLTSWGAKGMQTLTPLWLLKYLPNMLACHVTIIHDCRGPSNTITCAEVSGSLSLGESVRVIDRGQADACLTGGAEYKANPMGILRQHFAGRLAQTSMDDNPAEIVRPFDAQANGSVLGEGGGILVVEEFESAQSRDAHVYAEVTGFASTQSFCQDTVGLAIDPDDPALGDAVEGALHAAGVAAESIDAIVPLGVGIRSVDRAEDAAIARVFGERAVSIPRVLLVPAVGNCCAGASAVQLCVAAKMVRDQRIPGAGGESTLRNVLVMTPGMGGQNAAVVLSRVG